MRLILTFQRNVCWSIFNKYLNNKDIEIISFYIVGIAIFTKMLVHLSASIFTSKSNNFSLIEHKILLYNSPLSRCGPLHPPAPVPWVNIPGSAHAIGINLLCFIHVLCQVFPIQLVYNLKKQSPIKDAIFWWGVWTPNKVRYTL